MIVFIKAVNRITYIRAIEVKDQTEANMLIKRLKKLEYDDHQMDNCDLRDYMYGGNIESNSMHIKTLEIR
jgi:hypothetical protein